MAKYTSKILSELINKKCVLIMEDYFLFNCYEEIKCTILDVDNEWLKFTIIDERNVIKTQIFKIKTIQTIDFIEN